MPDELLKPHHWVMLEHLHTHLESFYEATLMVEGRKSTLADHFQVFDWLMNKIDDIRNNLAAEARHRRGPEAQAYKYLSDCAYASWLKCEKYFKLVDETPAYYAAIILNPTCKLQWFQEAWGEHDKKEWIKVVDKMVKDLWEEYKGKKCRNNIVWGAEQERDELAYADARSYKRVKSNTGTAVPPACIDHYEEYLTSNLRPLGPKENFDLIAYWEERLDSQPDLAQFALDVLAAPAMSDECERIFSSCKILLQPRRSRLAMDAIEANECLRHWYGPPAKETFEDRRVGVVEGEPDEQSSILEGNIDSWRAFVKQTAQADADGIAEEEAVEEIDGVNVTQEDLNAIERDDDSDISSEIDYYSN